MVPISSLQACREGGTHGVPFQDRDHDMTMDRRIMIFFFGLPSPPNALSRTPAQGYSAPP